MSPLKRLDEQLRQEEDGEDSEVDDDTDEEETEEETEAQGGNNGLKTRSGFGALRRAKTESAKERRAEFSPEKHKKRSKVKVVFTACNH